jgi:glycosyltransferase involved in cell wall biosynthesis
MKVLLVNNRYPSKKKPQVATYIVSIKDSLTLAGFEVDLLVSSRNWNSPVGKWLDLLLFWIKVLRFNNYKDYDWVYLNHFNLYLPFCRHKLNFNKTVFHWHGSDIYPKSVIWKVLTKYTLVNIPSSSVHIAPSKFFSKQVKKRFDINKIYVSPSGGVDTNTFKPLEQNRNASKLMVGFASHIIKSKGIELFLRLCADYENDSLLEFKLIAYGNELAKYQPRIDKLLNLKQVVPFAKSEMPSFYQSLDLLVMPTHSESLGLVPLEAMACNVPVLGTNDFALPEYILPGISGELFAMDNFDELKNAFQTYLQNRKSYSPRNVIIEKYSIQSVCDLYKSVLN